MNALKAFDAVKPLALLTIAFLFVELLSPIAFAQSLPPVSENQLQFKGEAKTIAVTLRKETISFAPAPAAAATAASTASAASPAAPSFTTGGCQVYEISAADRQKLWDNTMGFTPTEINDLPLSQALANTPGQFQNPMTQANAPVAAQGAQGVQDVRLIDLAGLKDVDPAQVAKDLCKSDKKCLDQYLDKDGNVYKDAAIPLITAEKYAEMKGSASASNPVLSQLQKLGLYGGQQGVSLPSPSPLPYENLKVGVPGSNEARLTDLFKAHAINPDACILDESIEGRVTYMALLNNDVTYGTPSKETLSGKYTSPATEKVDAELSDESVHQAFTGSGILGYLNLNGGSNILLPAFYEDWIKSVKKFNDFQFYFSAAVGLVGAGMSMNLAQLKVQRLQTRKELLEGSSLVSQTVVGSDITMETQVPLILENGVETKQSLGNYVGKQRYEFMERAAELEKSADQYEKWRPIFDRMKNAALPQLTASIMFGMGWIGTARLIYEVNSGLILTAAGARNGQYVKVFVNKPVANGFRAATNLFGGGSFFDTISKYTGLATPAKAFNVGPVFLINYPSPIDVVQESRLGNTVILNTQGSYSISTKWFGPSYTLNFEDVRKFGDADKYTSLPLVTNKVLPEAVINTRVQGSVFKYLTALAIPMILFRGLGPFGRIFGVAGFLKGFEMGMNVDENYGKDVACDPADLSKMKSYYKWITYLGGVLQVAVTVLPGIPALSKNMLAASLRTATDITSALSPVTIAQIYWGNKAMQYVTTCKDSQYKILAFQQLPGTVKKQATGLQEKLSPIQDLTDKLKLGTAAKESLQPSAQPLDQMTEILNFKAQMTDQQGYVAPSEIYYLQIEQSVFSVKSSLWDLLAKKCRENYQDASKTVTLGGANGGVALYDKQGRLLAAFNDYAWQLRALARMRSQENARVVLPNKIIETTLACGDKPFISVPADGSASLEGDCAAATCLKQQIKAVTGKDFGKDLSSVIGKISSVDTSEGIASFGGQSISFTRVLPSGGEKAGVQDTAPSMDDYAKLAGSQLEGARLDVLGNGAVVLNGPSGSTVKNEALGTLKTIIGSQGKIEYNSADGTLLVFIYTLAEASAQGISAVTASASNNTLADGTQVPAIKLNAHDKTGVQTGVPEALNQIQGPGGMQSIETADHIYYFTQDANGNPILRVIDKKTGQATDYQITGPVTRDAQGNLVVPTDKGPITIGVGMQNGQPTVTAKGLGIDELLPLLVARGQNGILTFNPTTGAINVYNGQDIPLSPEFANKGIGFTGDANGNTVGTPQSSYFGAARPTGAATTNSGLLALPSWPDDALLVALMLAAVLLGVAAVRWTERKEND